MNQNKLSSRLYPIIKSAVAAAMLPILFIYVMVAKPDYRIMNAMAHVVVPVATAVGDVVTWPVRVIGRAGAGIRELSNLRAENEELRARLDAALENRQMCENAILENQKLSMELDLVHDQPRRAQIANVKYDNTAFHHSTFIIDRGVADGISAGMAVVSTDGALVGTVADVAAHFARVRAITDANTTIAVRVVGSEVYGFITGNGGGAPTMGLFSDPEFQPARGVRLVTSNISGVLPGGINVGVMTNDTDVDVRRPETLSRVMVLEFDTLDEYNK